MRISGPRSLEIAQNLTKRKVFEPNILYLASLQTEGTLIDKAMVVYFKAPNSFTGEDVVELHVHGSIAILKLLTQVLFSYDIRMAQAGEFSKRAFLNGKMDLTAAEGLADMIDAETILQHNHAMRHMSGEFEELCNEWRASLLRCLSLLEAYIDFPDEDIPDVVLEASQAVIDDLKASLKVKLTDNRNGERLRNGIVMAVLGEPNVGKSSMMNFLSGRDVSIVSDIAGTTRDVIETHLDIGGYPIILADTAGLREETEDVIEKEGMSRAVNAAKSADIKLIMLDAKNLKKIPPKVLMMIDDQTILVVNKIDLEDTDVKSIEGQELVKISLKTKKGLDSLIEELIQKSAAVASVGSSPAITRERHRAHITKAFDALDICNLKGDLVLAAEDIRIAARNLSLLTGKIEVEEILGEIFRNFCIGK